jgi:hypothetical protein
VRSAVLEEAGLGEGVSERAVVRVGLVPQDDLNHPELG